MSMDRLLRELDRGKPGPRASMRWAEVSAVGTGTVDLTIAGGSVPGVPHLASYAPTEGDVVLCLAQGADLVVLGTLAPLT